uniref:BPTI/Kunitz inhibitor domain-containing protein n=1 Tax=Caenorhabditis tropicalis TaxID=1561998 RepID=A0A1I7TYW2_9PELO
MHFLAYFLLVSISFLGVATQAPPDRCSKPINFGKKCSTAEPSIRYHFDEGTGLCMAFKFEGCDGNENNFETESWCSSACKPTDIVGCPANSKPLKKSDGNSGCRESCNFIFYVLYCRSMFFQEQCGSDGYCSKRLSGGGICCSKAVRKNLVADYNPECGTNREVVKVNDDVLIGKNCDSNFCPDGSKCKKGNYFSTCCKKV